MDEGVGDLDSAEIYAEAVLRMVEAIPPGKAMSYGQIADYLREGLGHGGPRTVARVLSTVGGTVAWWRVVNSVGRLPPGHEGEAHELLVSEGCPMANGRVDLSLARWRPSE